MLEEPCTLVIALAETPPSRQQARAAASAARGPSVVRRFHCGCETPRIVSDSFLRNKILSLARVGELGRLTSETNPATPAPCGAFHPLRALRAATASQRVLAAGPQD